MVGREMVCGAAVEGTSDVTVIVADASAAAADDNNDDAGNGIGSGATETDNGSTVGVAATGTQVSANAEKDDLREYGCISVVSTFCVFRLRTPRSLASSTQVAHPSPFPSLTLSSSSSHPHPSLNHSSSVSSEPNILLTRPSSHPSHSTQRCAWRSRAPHDS